MLMENSRPGSLARHGLDWESVHARYPRLVYGSISGYGDVGPDAGRGGFDLILQAESGLMSVTGTEEPGPGKVGAPVLGAGAGLSCALGMLAACIQRQRTGARRLVPAPRPPARWRAGGAGAGSPAAEAAALARALPRPQARALGATQELARPSGGASRLVGPPLRVDQAALGYPAPAPGLGSDTRAVL